MVYNSFLPVDSFVHKWRSQGASVSIKGDIVTVHICGGTMTYPVLTIDGVAVVPIYKVNAKYSGMYINVAGEVRIA